MRWIIPLLVLLTVLETVSLQGFVTRGLHPELVLVVVIGWAALRGWEEGLLVGLVGGFMADALSAAPFGTNTLRLGAAGFAAGMVLGRLAQQSVLLPVAAAAFCSLAGYFLSILAFQAAGWSVSWERPLVVDAIPSAVVASGVMALAFPLLRALVQRLAGPDDAAEI